MFKRVWLFAALSLFAALFLSATVSAAPSGPAPSPAPLRVGLLPTIPTLRLMRLYDPLRVHLQRVLGQPVELFTASDFHAHLQDVQKGEFDLLVTAPHFGVMAADGGYVPLFRYQLELRPLIIVPKASPIHEPRQLKGKKVYTADRLAALSVVAERWLASDYNMVAGRDYQLVEASNHSTAIRAVAIGEADAAISGRSPLAQVTQDLRDKVDFFECRFVVPHQFFLAHERLGAAAIERIRAALASFPATEEGKTFLAEGGFLGLVPLDTSDIETARPYADLVLRTQGGGR